MRLITNLIRTGTVIDVDRKNWLCWVKTGDLETAFALPAVYSNQYPPPSDSEDGSVTEYDDGGWFEYDPATGR